MARSFIVTTDGVDWPEEKLAGWIQAELQGAANGGKLPLDVQGVEEVKRLAKKAVEAKPVEAPPKRKR